MKENETPITIRFKNEILEKVRELAEIEHRSFNGMVNWILENFIDMTTTK